MFAISLGDGAELRPLEPWQAEEFLAHMDRGRAFIGRHIGLPDATTDLDSARRWLQSYADKAAADAGRLYGIWLEEVLVGGCMFVSFDADSGVAEIGCWLEPSATGRGLITTACRLLIDWAFRTRGLHRVEWHCRTDNTASSNVARRLGLKLEATLRENYPWKGVRHDTEIWAVLAPDWR